MLVCKDLSRIPADFETSGIYSIQHINSNRTYVGSSARVRARLWQHLRMLRTNNHHSSYLQHAWNKYGQIAFVVCLLEKVSDIKRLTKTEQKWIDALNAYNYGFNARPNAESMHGISWTDDQNARRRISNVHSWANPKLREELSKRFVGLHRGVWTKESKEKSSRSLKAFHADHPDERLKFRARVWEDPIACKRRIDGIRRSLERVDVYHARLTQLRNASQSPKRLSNLRSAYHIKKGYQALGYPAPEDITRKMILLYRKGMSLRQIGRELRIDHKAVANRLRKQGISVQSRCKRGSAHPLAKLTETNVRDIRRFLVKGDTQVKIATRFNVSNSVISEINTRKAWRHVR